MEISVLEGYKNPISGEMNSVSLRINTNKLLDKHMKNVKKEDDLFKTMSDLLEKYKSITFYHTFRLVHDDKKYVMIATRHKGSLYKTTKKSHSGC